MRRYSGSPGHDGAADGRWPGARAACKGRGDQGADPPRSARVLGPGCTVPPPHGLSTPRLDVRLSPFLLGPATRRSGAYQDGNSHPLELRSMTSGSVALALGRHGAPCDHGILPSGTSLGATKIERFFGTVRGASCSADTASLDGLNRRLWAYLEGEYHQNPHRGLDGDTPLQRWAAVGGEVRYLDASLDLDDLFLAEARRRVMNDRTLSLNGRLYEVDPLLVGQTVTVRYDPAVPPTRPLQVLHNGADAGVATILDAYANAYRHQSRDHPPGPVSAQRGARRLEAVDQLGGRRHPWRSRRTRPRRSSSHRASPRREFVDLGAVDGGRSWTSAARRRTERRHCLGERQRRDKGAVEAQGEPLFAAAVRAATAWGRKRVRSDPRR